MKFPDPELAFYGTFEGLTSSGKNLIPASGRFYYNPFYQMVVFYKDRDVLEDVSI
jgi:hypothetical protein